MRSRRRKQVHLVHRGRHNKRGRRLMRRWLENRAPVDLPIAPAVLSIQARVMNLFGWS